MRLFHDNGPWLLTSFADSYLRYNLLIDFLVFAAVFMSLARGTLRHRFPGRPGKLMSVAIGIGLSLSLTLGMHRWELSLLDVAWLPMALLVLVMLLCLASAVKNRWVDMPGALGMAILIVGVVGALTMAEGGQARRLLLQVILPWLGLALLIFLVLPYLFAKPSAGGAARRDQIVTAGKQRIRRVASLTETTAKAGIERSYWLGRRIQQIKDYLRQNRYDKVSPDALKAELLRIGRIENEFGKRLSRMARITRRLERADARSYGELAKNLRSADIGGRSHLSQRLALQWTKIHEEDETYHLARKAVHQVDRIRHCLAKAEHCLKADNPKRAERWMASAFQRQQRLSELFGKLARWERRLGQLAGKSS